MNVRFLCPTCEYPAKVHVPGPKDWHCANCDHIQDMSESFAESSPCVVCQNAELYRKKDFPHGLGLFLLTAACVVSFITYGYYKVWLTWCILIGTAIFDAVLYLCVGDVVVCYRCNAHYRGLKNRENIPAFDLGIAERYRQERIRKELMEKELNHREHGVHREKDREEPGMNTNSRE